METDKYKNSIQPNKRIILHHNEALQLVSFSETDPKYIKEWRREGKTPILFDARSWELIQDTKWKLVMENETIQYVEYIK